MNAIQTLRLGVFLGWDREDTARNLAERYGVPIEQALDAWDAVARAAQEREIADAHDELLDAEARRQEHGAL